MSANQVRRLIQEGHVNPGGKWDKTCMVLAADAFHPNDAPPSIYDWVAGMAASELSAYDTDPIYERIVSTLWDGAAHDTHITIGGTRQLLSGGRKPIFWGWEDNKKDKAEYDQIMDTAHRLGLIAVLYTAFKGDDSHVEGFIPYSTVYKREPTWLNRHGYWLKTQDQPAQIRTKNGIWKRDLCPDNSGMRWAYFYPKPPVA